VFYPCFFLEKKKKAHRAERIGKETKTDQPSTNFWKIKQMESFFSKFSCYKTHKMKDRIFFFLNIQLRPQEDKFL
jgi:hypothetical protein